MAIIEYINDALRFKDTVFFKENSDLQDRYEALTKLNSEYPKNDNIQNEMYCIKKGLDGEKEIEYQLKKANVGMYVLHDVKLKYKDLTAQIDYVVITPVFTYYIECKNLVGNITVNEKGDFIREYNINGKKIKKGMYSPLRQVEAQREVVRKIWENNVSSLKRIFASKNFNYYRRVLVVAANQDTVLNTYKAPKDIKNKVLRADALVRQIQYEYEHRNKYDYVDNKNDMEKEAQSYINLISDDNIDYYEYYKEKYCKELFETDKELLKEKLIQFRKERSAQMKIPAYYVLTNDELDKIVELRPKTLDELKKINILTPIKIKKHGEKIIEVINE